MASRKFKEATIPADLVLRVRHCRGIRWITYATLIDAATENIVAASMAVCSADDQPSRKIGRAIAVGRCLKKYYGGDRRLTT